MAPEATEAYGEKAFRPEIGFEDSPSDQRGIMDKDPLNSIGPHNEEGYQDESDQRDIVDKNSLGTIDYPSSRDPQDEPE
eukprot:9884619-Alexandrium_andersonii.AAC.1